MGRLNSETRDQLRAAIAAEVERGNKSPRGIARALGCDPRTVRAHLHALELPQAPTRTAPDASPQTAAVDDERQRRARERLWAVLEDPSTPPQGVVSAFNALAESEAWTVQATELPEPKTEQEAIERLVALLRSLPESVVRAALGRLS